jgi:SpoVK/Ycf46/Vps4 family AAA+-type ATPase
LSTASGLICTSLSLALPLLVLTYACVCSCLALSFPIQVIMATNRIESLDPALIRPGRIDRKIEFPLPDIKTKRRIFNIHTSRMTLSDVSPLLFTWTPYACCSMLWTRYCRHIHIAHAALSDVSPLERLQLSLTFDAFCLVTKRYVRKAVLK